MNEVESVDGETQEAESAQAEESYGEVPLTDATSEELDAFLDNAMEAEESLEEEAPQEPEVEQEQPQTSPEEGEDSQEEQTDPEEERAALLSQLQQQEAFIQKRNSEIGDLRKQLREANAKLVDYYKQVHIEDPEKALAIQNQINENKKQEKELDEESNSINRRHQSQLILAHHVPKEDWDIVAMRESLASDGLPNDAVQQFVQDPLMFTRPDVLVQLAKRAKAEKNLKILAKYAKGLLEKIKQSEGAKKQVVKQIASNLRKSPAVSNGNGGSAAITRGIDPSNLSKLSEKELDELIGASED